MKDAQEMIDQIEETVPGVDQALAIQKLSEALPPKYLERYLRGFIKGDTLFFIFDHPGMVQEFNFKKTELLRSLREVYGREKMQKLLWFKKVVAMSDFKKQQEIAITKPGVRISREVAEGNFENRAEDPSVKSRMEDIRNIIHAKRENERGA